MPLCAFWARIKKAKGSLIIAAHGGKFLYATSPLTQIHRKLLPRDPTQALASISWCAHSTLRKEQLKSPDQLHCGGALHIFDVELRMPQHV